MPSEPSPFADLAAGPDLDARMMAEILGYQDRPTETCADGHCWHKPDGTFVSHQTPPFSTRWDDAMQIVEHLRNWLWTVELEQSPRGRWHCLFVRAMYTGWEEWGDTGPQAICRAALGAKTLGPVPKEWSEEEPTNAG